MAEESTPDVQKAEAEVQAAVEHTAEAAKAAPTAGLEDILREIHQGLVSVHSEIKRTNDLREAEKSAKTVTEPIVEPVEEVAAPIVDVPKKEIKYARRGLRKVRVD
jgi:hypothetical protein